MIHQAIQNLHSMFRADNLNLLFLHDLFIFFHVQKMLKFDKATYLSLLYKFILSERFSNSLSGSDVKLFSEFINIVSIQIYNFIQFILLLHTFLVVYYS